ncbi:SAM-dependent methyltransferase [Crossiella sp. CA-258035]|uniref:SAM-dependent methyltransferase n=1 Tax=Crossiella sp. CA-258035 TaxID=2981138 RepID=UPI0024BD13BC|nr:SAM-dependent methyltransferase [Crossiella sp. CA-258035]WHT16785.1 SAM-dependent methyltransferase [Crossiella sp. CA-258035]
MGPDELGWVRGEIDLSRANPARMYDYFLGGTQNFPVDRELADAAIALRPEMPRSARLNRAFLGRAVRYAVDLGLRQFLDLGSGIPTEANVHEVAHAADRRCRIAYVDAEPVAVAHSHRLLAGHPRVSVTQADLRDVSTVLAADGVRAQLDFGQPIALLLVAVLHFLPDEDDPAEVVRRYAERLAPGSLVAISHVTTDNLPPEWRSVAGLYQRSATPIHPRPKADVLAMFGELALVPPGLVDAVEWRPDRGQPALAVSGFYAGAARKT